MVSRVSGSPTEFNSDPEADDEGVQKDRQGCSPGAVQHLCTAHTGLCPNHNTGAGPGGVRDKGYLLSSLHAYTLCA